MDNTAHANIIGELLGPLSLRVNPRQRPRKAQPESRLCEVFEVNSLLDAIEDTVGAEQRLRSDHLKPK
jgi:hypothetical protein